MNQERKEVNKQTVFSLDKAFPYQIQAAGQLSKDWSSWNGDLIWEFDIHPIGVGVTKITGSFDQAALIGLLRRLYSLGLPLIAVNAIQNGKIKRKGD
jgi:hypothetical protein